MNRTFFSQQFHFHISFPKRAVRETEKRRVRSTIRQTDETNRREEEEQQEESEFEHILSKYFFRPPQIPSPPSPPHTHTHTIIEKNNSPKK